MRVGKSSSSVSSGMRADDFDPESASPYSKTHKSGGSNGNGNGMNANGKDKKHPGGGSSALMNKG